MTFTKSGAELRRLVDRQTLYLILHAKWAAMARCYRSVGYNVVARECAKYSRDNLRLYLEKAR